MLGYSWDARVLAFVFAFCVVHCGGDERPSTDTGGTAGANGGAGSPSDGGASSGRAGSSSAGAPNGGVGTPPGGSSGVAGGAPGGHGPGGASGHGGDAGMGAGEAGAGGEGASGDTWEGCPTRDDYPGEGAWPHVLEVTAEATYCSTFSEQRTLKEELASKAILRVAPGTYRLPGESHPALALPICVRQNQGASAIPLAAGALRYEQTPVGESTSTVYDFVQPLGSAWPGEELQLQLRASHASGEPPALLLNGRQMTFDTWQSYRSILWCESPEDGCIARREFDSCTHEGSTLNLHEVELDRGRVTLHLRIGESPASTEPGAFVRANGSFDGQAFDQENYWKLVYRPAHHHFERDFAVLFDAPIAGACGIEISHLEPFDDYTADEAYTVDCELNRLAPLVLRSHVLTRDP